MGRHSVFRRRVVLGIVLLIVLFTWYLLAEAGRGRKNRALIEAIQSHDLARMNAFLDEGADPNTRDTYSRSFSWQAFEDRITNNRTSRTALHVALENDSPPEFPAIQLLVYRGAD